jgi:integrase
MTKPKRLKNGTWQVRFRDLDKHQRARNFKSRKEAEAFIVELTYELKHGTWLDDRKGRVLLSEIWSEFIGLKGAKKANTIADYRSMWKVHLEPKWGNTPINRITQNAFDQWVISLGLSARRTRKLHLLASMIFDVAVKGEFLKRNPLKDPTGKRDASNLPTIAKRQVGMSLTLDQLLNLARNAGYFHDHILFLGLTGARWGEFVALKVSDLDLTRGVVRISKSISEIEGVPVLSETTKNHQDREVKLVDFLLKRASSWIEGKNSDDFLFTSPEGSILRKANFSRRIFIPALEKTGLPRIRIHDLRWTAISIASSLGISQQVVRVQVGHSNAHMTNAYTKIFQIDQTEAVEKLNNAVNEVHEKCTPEIVSTDSEYPVLEIHAQKELDGGINSLEEWLRQQDYESGALTN